MHAAGWLEWGVAARPLPGEVESGDGHFVKETVTGWVLAVGDGLGHGREAALAKRAVIDVLGHYAGEPLADLFRRCHTRLRSTRGSAISIAVIEAASGTLCWFGVGNVEGLLLRAAENAPQCIYIALRGGIVGYRLPEVRPAVLPLQDGDLLVLATDGIGEGFTAAIAPNKPPQAIADRILANFARRNDDALVLVARWRTGAASGSTRA